MERSQLLADGITRGGIRRLVDRGALIPHGRHSSLAVAHTCTVPSPAHIGGVEGIRVTTPARTPCDLATATSLAPTTSSATTSEERRARSVRSPT